VPFPQCLYHLQLKRRICRLACLPCDFKHTRLGVLEEVFQRSHSEAGPRIELKLVSPEVAEHTHRQFGARDQNIESTVPALAVQRAKLPGNSARLVTPIADADEDLVPLIPLD